MGAGTFLIDPDQGAGHNYHILFDWEAAQQSNLTGTGACIAQCTSSSGTADTTPVVIDGWTTTESDYIEIIAYSGDEAVKTGIDTSRYRLHITANDNHSIDILEDWVHVRNLQFKVTQGVNTNVASILYFESSSANSTCKVDSCYFQIVGTDGSSKKSAIGVADENFTVKIYNCIFYGNLFGRFTAWVNSGVINIYNCSARGFGYAANSIYIFAGTLSVVNTAVFNNNTNNFGAGVSVDHCASDTDTGTNNVVESGGGADWTDDFVDAANGDFTLKSTSNLVGSGTDDPGSGLYSDDIDGVARTSTWDVGADEYVAVITTLSVVASECE